MVSCVSGNNCPTSKRYAFLYRLTPREFNSYGSRRGNDDIMARGTFANIRLVNKFMQKAGPKTVHVPSGISITTTIMIVDSLMLSLSGDAMDVFDAAERYQKEGRSLVILAGRDYGSGKRNV